MIIRIIYTYTMWKYTKATYDLLATSQQANAINQKTFYMQHRPWLYIATLGNIKFDERRKTYQYTFSTSNSGGSPALSISTVVTTFVDSNAQYEQQFYEAILFPNREMVTIPELRGQQYADIKEGLRKVEIFVLTWYRYLENIPHHTRQKLSIHDGGRNVGINSLDIDSNSGGIVVAPPLPPSPLSVPWKPPK